MGMYDTVWFKDKTGEDIDIQFKCGENICQDYELGSSIQLGNGIYFGFGGCFVVYDKKVVAIFDEESLFDKWGGRIKFPDLNNNHPLSK